MRSLQIYSVGALLLATEAVASFESVATVLQPFDHDGTGLIACVATYTGYDFDSTNPTSLVLLTTAVNSVMCNGEPCNRNEAAKRGIRFVHETKPDPQGGGPLTAWPRVQNDTLQVRVDVRPATLSPGSNSNATASRLWNEEAVALTLWCGLRNVRRFAPQVNYVEYQVEGSKDLARYSGVYSLTGVDPVCKNQVWDFKSFGPITSSHPANRVLQPPAPHDGQK